MSPDYGRGKNGAQNNMVTVLSLFTRTAPRKRSSVAWSRSATSGLLLGRYHILHILFTNLSCPPTLQSPTKMERRIKGRVSVVTLATTYSAAGGSPCAARTRRA